MSTRNKNKTENRQNYQAGSPLPRQRSTFRKNRNERKECQQNKKSRSKKTTFKAAAAVCGAGILGRCPLVGLVPCYPVCHLLPALVNRGFPTILPPSLPIPLDAAHTDAWRFLLNFASFSCHLIINRSDASRTPRHHWPAFFAVIGHSAVSTPNSNGECTVDPWVARKRSSTNY